MRLLRWLPVFCLVITVLQLTTGCRESSPPAKPVAVLQRPPVKRAAQPHGHWIKEWSAALPVTARLKVRPRTEKDVFSEREYRAYVIRLQIENRTPYRMEQSDPAFLFESAGKPTPGEKQGNLLTVAGARFNETPVANYSGAFEYRGDEGLHPRQFVNYGLFDGEVHWRNGQILRREESGLTFITSERAIETEFAPAAPKATANISSELLLGVVLKRDKLNEVWYATPELGFASASGERARFRYLLGFSPPASPLQNWMLTATRLVSLDADGLLPLVADTSAPTCTRVFSAYWAADHAKEAAGPAFLKVLAANPAEHPSLRCAALSGVRALAYAPALPKVTAALRDSEEPRIVRRFAANAVGAIGDAEVVPDLFQCATGTDANMAEIGIDALCKLPDKSGAMRLVELLRDARYAKLHEDIGTSLRGCDDSELTEQLVQVAQDKTTKGRTAAIRALGGRKDPNAVSALRALCLETGSQVRAAACGALARNPDEPSVAALSAALEGTDAKTAEQTADGLAAEANAISDQLLTKALAGSHLEALKTAARALVTRKRPIRDQLVQALSRKEPAFRAAAAGGLSQLKDRSACSAVIGLLRDPASEVRAAAAESCGESNCVDALEKLAPLMLNDEYDVRRAAATAVGIIADRRAVPALISLVKNGSDDLQHIGAAALGVHGDPAAIDALSGALRSGDSRLQRSAAYALARIKDDRAIDALVKALRSEDSYLRQCAASALERSTGLDYWQDIAAWTKSRTQPMDSSVGRTAPVNGKGVE